VRLAYAELRGKLVSDDWTMTCTKELERLGAVPFREDGRVYWCPPQSLDAVRRLQKLLAEVGVVVVGLLGLATACRGNDKPSRGGGLTTGDEDAGSDADGDTGADTDSDSDGDTDDLTDAGPDCSNCPALGADDVGHSLANMACAVDLCGAGVVEDNQFESPTGSQTQDAYAAVERFGDPSNDLAPKLNESYALMATGPAMGTSHSVEMGDGGAEDPYASDPSAPIYDAMEWKLRLKAPQGAHGFQVDYVFFSEEYDEYVGSGYNDKFYIFLEAPSTNHGKRTVINFTDCRKGTKGDMTCDQALADMGLCTVGEEACHIAVNTALSECCWYGGCPDGESETDISGTGFECAADEILDHNANGSSTGWLRTEWMIDPGEEFNVIFHIHDTNDRLFDSEVILDRFLFLAKADPGTVPVE
jgi:hypothetical protein